MLLSSGITSSRISGTRRGWRRLSVQPVPETQVESFTGPLDQLAGRQVLALLDCENLSISAQRLGYRFSYRSLGCLLRNVVAEVQLHAFFSRDLGDERLVKYFIERGFIPHARDIETVMTCKGQRKLANSDLVIAFHAGTIASRTPATHIILGSGDGDLVCELAKLLGRLPRKRSILTLSLPGATSHRLDARQNPSIVGNVECGKDILREICFRGNSPEFVGNPAEPFDYVMQPFRKQQTGT